MTKQHLCSVMPVFVIAIIICAISPVSVSAQEQDTAIGEIEDLFAEEESSAGPSPTVTTKPQTSTAPGTAKPVDIKEVSDLGHLQPFDDVAVIQKRFLPKSSRFEFYIGPSLNLNDAFFFSLGGDVRLGYYFSERYGVELAGIYLSTSQRQVTDDLYQRGVRTSSFVSPRGYYGLDFKWTPSYGKMTWANKSITPFDLYLSIGGGLTPTNQERSEATVHVGTGQIFALSKSSALRWDLSWFMFSSKSDVDPSGGSSLYHNVLFSIGWSGFFPEATYR